MSDDLDDLLRRAMKTLDDQVPSGYFEGLPNRTLARLGEDSSMQTTTGSTDHNTGVPPQRDEDSGLHDLRSMASSTKMRLSSRRITQPPALDDDVLASSSAGWKAVALPEPARMVSLPEIEPAAEAPKSERKSKKEIKAERVSAKQVAAQAAVETSAPVAAAPVAAAPVAAKTADVATTPIIGARFHQQKKSKAGLYAALGMGLAAAAGVGWYVSTQMGSKEDKAAQVAVSTERAAQQVPAATPPASQPVSTAGSAAVAAEPAPADAADTKVATGMAMEENAAGAPGADDKPRTNKGAGTKAKKDDKVVIDLDSGPKRPEAAKDKKVEEPKPDTQKKEGEGEPSFDALLKEAGVSQDKKVEKPKLEKKSLSSADIKTGMNGVAGKAQACYNGQQGTAQVKLTVAPDGSVQKVSVTGVFAGTPVGSCVEAAVKGAKFPAWDGGPQSFGFSYLLAE